MRLCQRKLACGLADPCLLAVTMAAELEHALPQPARGSVVGRLPGMAAGECLASCLLNLAADWLAESGSCLT